MNLRLQDIYTGFIVTSCLMLILFSYSLAKNLRGLFQGNAQTQQILVELDPKSEVKVDTLKAKLNETKKVENIVYRNSEENYKYLKQNSLALRNITLEASDVESLILPTLHVFIKPAKDQEIEALAQEVKTWPGVVSADFGQNWKDHFVELLRGVEGLAWIFGLCLLMTVFFVIHSSLKNLVLEKKENIEILELLGARSFFIHKPFVVKGSLIGLIGGILAPALVYGLDLLAAKWISQNSVLSHFVRDYQALSVGAFSLSILMGLLVGLLSSWLTVWSLNSGWLAAQSHSSKGGP